MTLDEAQASVAALDGIHSRGSERWSGRSFRRPQRVEVDKDDEAEAVIARRRAAAEANARPLGRAEHTAFDARIRQEPADATATRATSIRRLRQAIVWREILGPPVSLRHPDDLRHLPPAPLGSHRQTARLPASLFRPLVGPPEPVHRQSPNSFRYALIASEIATRAAAAPSNPRVTVRVPSRSL